MREIAPGIFTWSVFSQEKGIAFNGHYVSNSQGRVLVDPPAMDDADAAWIETAGFPEAIVITNAHHTRSALTSAARWRIPILLPEKDVTLSPPETRMGGVHHDGDRLPAGLIVIGLDAQKTPGESALLCEASLTLIVGDALIGKPAGSLAMLPPQKFADPVSARAGLGRLLDFNFEALLLGDGASIPRGGKAALTQFLSS